MWCDRAMRTQLQASLSSPSDMAQAEHIGSSHASKTYTRSTKLSTTFFSPALSKAMVSLLPSIRVTWP
jgi:hypothetical protein